MFKKPVAKYITSVVGCGLVGLAIGFFGLHTNSDIVITTCVGMAVGALLGVIAAVLNSVAN